MIFEELLNGYFDGTLGQPDLAEFFHILSVSDEKRNAFTKTSQLRNALAVDRTIRRLPPQLAESTLQTLMGRGVSETFIPPVASRFAMSKMLMPLAIAAGMALTGWIGYAIGFDHGNSFASGASNAVATATPLHAGTASAQTTSSDQPVVNTSAQTISSNDPHSSANKQSGAVNKEYSNASSANKNNSTNDVAEIKNYTPLIDNSVGAHSASTAAASGGQAATPSNSDAQASLGNFETKVAAHEDQPVQIIMNIEEPEMFVNVADPAPKFEVDMAQGIRVAQSQINSAGLPTSPTFSMFRFHAGMHLSDQFSAGILVGQNTFALQYQEHPDPLTVTTISQYSSQVFGGAYARMELGKILGWVPGASVGAGFSTFGMIGDFELSASHPLFGNVWMFAGLHADALLYKHAGAAYNSETGSFITGIAAGF